MVFFATVAAAGAAAAGPKVSAAAAAAAAAAGPQAAAAMDQVLRRIAKSGGAEHPLDAAMAFLSAVDWSAERWLWALYVLFVALFVTALAARRSWPAQLLVLLTAVVSVLSASELNALGRVHWASFATQNYFDAGGVFISVVWSTPMIIIAFFVLVRRRHCGCNSTCSGVETVGLTPLRVCRCAIAHVHRFRACGMSALWRCSWDG
jgi:hypothetical protein